MEKKPEGAREEDDRAPRPEGPGGPLRRPHPSRPLPRSRRTAPPEAPGRGAALPGRPPGGPDPRHLRPPTGPRGAAPGGMGGQPASVSTGSSARSSCSRRRTSPGPGSRRAGRWRPPDLTRGGKWKSPTSRPRTGGPARWSWSRTPARERSWDTGSSRRAEQWRRPTWWTRRSCRGFRGPAVPRDWAPNRWRAPVRGPPIPRPDAVAGDHAPSEHQAPS